MADALQQNSVLQYKLTQMQEQLDIAEDTILQLTAVIGAIVAEAGGHVAIPQVAVTMTYNLTYAMQNGLMLMNAEQEVE